MRFLDKNKEEHKKTIRKRRNEINSKTARKAVSNYKRKPRKQLKTWGRRIQIIKQFEQTQINDNHKIKQMEDNFHIKVSNAEEKIKFFNVKQ